MKQKLILSSLLICSNGFATPIITDNQTPPTTSQMIATCENNTGAANCPEIVSKIQATLQARQESLQHPTNIAPSPNAQPIPDQPETGSNPTMQPNYNN